MSRQQLINGIITSLRAVASNIPVLSSATRTDKIYEIFILSCVVRTLNSLGAQIEARDSNDNSTSTLIFRLGPGLIYNPTSAPGFIYINYQGREYELQNSVRVLGYSNVLHELDVCIITRSESVNCRRNQINPKQGNVKLLLECKFYGATLPLKLGREYLGLGREFRLRIKTIVSNQTSEEIHSLVTKHKGTENFSISPANPNNVDMFVQWLANELRQVL